MKVSCLLSSLFLFSLALNAQTPAHNNAVPLTNWAAPQYWLPTQSEREISQNSSAKLQLSPNQTSNTPLIFVAVTPCRLVDTRGASAGFIGLAPFNGPYIQAQQTVTFPVQNSSGTTAPAPCGTIPTTAQAYSVNVTVVPHPSGNPVNYVSIWPAGYTQPVVSTVNDVQGAVVANAAIVPAGTPYGAISVFSYGDTDIIIDVNGFYTAPTDVTGDTAIGTGTLSSLSTGTDNTAIGSNALTVDSIGSGNTAAGFEAMQSNTTGSFNAAFGIQALIYNTTGSTNTAAGNAALHNNVTGSSNTGIGVDALASNYSGSYNTALGANALWFNSGGSRNIALGFAAGLNANIGSDNIYIYNQGASGDNAVIRVGTQGTQLSTSIAGIYGASPATPNLPVCIDSTGTLGTSGCSITASSTLLNELQEENRKLADRLAALESLLATQRTTAAHSGNQ